MIMRCLLSAALLLSASCSSADAAANAIQRNTRLDPQPKILGRLPDTFEHVAIATHSAVSKMARDGVAPSNDDPELIEQLLMSINVNETNFSRTPTAEPVALAPASGSALMASPTPSAGPRARETATPSSSAELTESQATQAPMTRATEAPTLITVAPSPAPSKAAPTVSLSAELSTSSPSLRPSLAPSMAAPTIHPSAKLSTSSPSLRPSLAPSTAAPTSFPSTTLTTSTPTLETTQLMSPVPTPVPQLPMNPSPSFASYTPSAVISATEAPTSTSTRVNTDAAIETTPYPTHSVEGTIEPTFVPTYSPSIIFTASPTTTAEFHQHSSSNSTANSFEPQDLEPCPVEFDKSVHYRVGDVVSAKRSRRNCYDGKHVSTNKNCYVIFRCKPWPEGAAYCNVHQPGKRKSEEGWLELTRCKVVPIVVDGPSDSPLSAPGDNPPVELSVDDQAGLPSSIPTKSPMIDGDDTDMSANTPSPLPSVMTAKPTSSNLGPHDNEQTHQASSSPTSVTSSFKGSPYSSIWTKPANIGNNNTQAGTVDIPEDAGPPNVLSVKLPRIICDISLSPSLSSNFEHKHILLAAMTNIIYDICKHEYAMTGISLNVEVTRNGNIYDSKDIEAASTATSSLVRLHAFLRGSASFTLQGDPTPDELLTLLVRHFDVDEFNRRLQVPLNVVAQARTAKSRSEETIKVNSVFFTLEDGSLILAGSAYEEQKFPITTTTVAHVGQGGNVQVSLVLSALIAMACVIALVMSLIYSNRINEFDTDAIASTSESRLEEGQSKIAERGGSLDTDAKVGKSRSMIEIEVPSTPHIAMSDVSVDNSDLSSLSESPFMSAGAKKNLDYYTSSAATPSIQGIGIAKANRYRYAGDDTLGFGMNQNWEVYQDTTMFESP